MAESFVKTSRIVIITADGAEGAKKHKQTNLFNMENTTGESERNRV